MACRKRQKLYLKTKVDFKQFTFRPVKIKDHFINPVIRPTYVKKMKK